MSQATVETTKISVPTESANILKEFGLGNSVKPTIRDEKGQFAKDPDKTDETVKAAEPAKVDTKHADEKAEKKPAEKVESDEVVRLNKQLTDTRNAFTQERQTNKQLLQKQQALESKLDIVMKKLDGTYDEAKDGPKPPQPDEVQRSERVATSHWAAVDKYGEEYVMKTVWADDAPFRKFDNDPAVQARVMNSRVPILEAIKVVKEAEAKEKYGDDPETMRKTITEELKESLTKEIRQQLLKELGRGTNEEVKGLANVRQAADTKPSDKGRLDFNSLFPGFAKSAG